MSTENNKSLVRHMMDWWVKGDLNVIDELMSPDFVCHTASGETVGRDAQRQRLAAFLSMFSDRLLTIDELIGEVDKVAMRYTWEATHRGEAFGIAPTGKRVKSSTIAIYRVAVGKIAEEWEEHDTQGLFQQLGAFSRES